MEVIEHKCPGCGANLEFEKSATSCQCEYCKKKFIINKEKNTEPNDINYNYVLKESTKKNMWVFFVILLFFMSPFIFMIGFFVISLVISLFVWLISLIFGFPVITDINSITNDNYDTLDFEAEEVIENKARHIYDYELSENIERENTYLITYNNKDDENLLIPIYRVNFESYSNGSHYTLFIPIKYVNVKKYFWDLGDGKVSAPRFCLNKDSQCTYGYTSLDDAYNDVIKPLKDDTNNYKVEAEE